MSEKKKRIEWHDAEIHVLRRAGKWLVGVLIQESSDGRTRAKIFKAVIKENGSKEIVWKGKTYKISMIQRLNIPSYDYWEKLVSHVTPILKKAFKVKKGTLEEFTS
ncbi:MAG: hypothetical protein ACP6IS_00340 [Candidatus Asgardarchaeia archaeon]